MAERRMFSKRIVRSAKFLKMPVSSRELYWQLGIEADDDGIVESFNVMRMTGSTEDDLRVLVSKGFVQVLNEDLVAYITDWNENNKLRADRKVDSIYKHLLLQMNPDVQLIQAKPRADTKKLTGQPMDNQWTSNGQHSIGKDSIVQESIEEVSIVEKKKKIDIEKKKTYFENDNLNSIFIEFLEVRKKLKAVNSDRAIKTLINKLNKYDDDTKYQMIENSIVNSWKDVYELKQKKTTSYARQEIVPDWFGKNIEKEAGSKEEQDDLKNLIENFDNEPFEEQKEKLQEKLKAKYGKRGTDD
ncbi:MAG: hypothetical protein MR691_14920 [Clostridium sp.]|nr:hypothetical protein [Clostridium sp.]